MNRLVHINPIEPAAFSGRAPAGFDCVIDITYRTAADATWTSDLAATLVLTGRTTDRSTSYIVPATDVVNGKARAVIPGGDLSDPNGYHMTLVGTVDSARAVLASGTLLLTEEAIPDVAAADVIDQVPLLLRRGQDADLQVNLWQDASKAAEYPIGSASIGAAVYDAPGGVVLVPFTVTVLDNNSAHLEMASADVDTLPDTCWWTLTIAAAGGLTTLAQGPVNVQDAP